MIKKFTFFSVILFFGLFIWDITGYTYSDMPPAMRTGAPSESSCNTGGCHNSFATNNGLGSLNISLVNGPSQFKLDSIYTIKIQVDDPGKLIYGFEITALDSLHKPAGTFSLISAGNTALLSGKVGGLTRRYVSHNNATSNNTWQFKWKAPATAVGNVTFYAVGNAGDNAGGASGDYIYTNNLTFAQDTNIKPTTAIHTLSSFAYTLYPNPSTDKIWVQTNSSFIAYIYNAAGKLMVSQSGAGTTSIDLGNAFSTGIYYIHLVGLDGSQASQQVFISKN